MWRQDGGLKRHGVSLYTIGYHGADSLAEHHGSYSGWYLLGREANETDTQPYFRCRTDVYSLCHAIAAANSDPRVDDAQCPVRRGVLQRVHAGRPATRPA